MVPMVRLINKIIKQTAAYESFKQRKKAMQRWIRLPLYRGDQYHCPVCDTGLKRFKPIWKSYLRNVREYGFMYPLEEMETFNFNAYSCPACDASDRERLFALYFEERLGSLDGGKTYTCLDFGASPSLSKKLRALPFLRYRTADLYRPVVDERVDICDMRSYQDQSIDMFICSHILEHVSDDRKAMQELHRVLRSGGFGIVMVPLVVGVEDTHEDSAITDSNLRWKYYGQNDHLRLYGRRDFVKRLASVEFSVQQLGAAHFGLERFRTAGIHDNSVLYVVERG